MGILKTITEEYFGDTIRKEDEINIEGLDVEIVSFTDNNGKYHGRGYKPKNLRNLKNLLERMIEKRGNEGDFNDIDTSEITSMKSLFERNNDFNGDITGWDVSNVIDMNSMFDDATSFNRPIGNWDVSEVTNMSCMFNYATSFNRPIGDWNVSEVTDMSSMFNYATSFNQPIGDWKFPKVKDINYMFQGAKSFNQDLSKWNLKGKYIGDMFRGCPIKDEYKPKMK